jgi:hypothetical protein
MYARRQTRPKPRRAEFKSFAAPTAGWVANRNIADPRSIEGQGAAVLDNFIPKSSSVVLRRGKQRYATIGGDTLSMFTYDNGLNDRMFAASETTIFDITGPAGPGDSGIVVGADYGSGRWSVAQFATTGGVYLIGVNGVDPGFIFDGTTFSPLTGITVPNGLTTADLAYVWVYKNRLWFAARDSMDAYYTDMADSIGGNLSWFPLSGIFGRGGSLQYGATWSLDNGAEGGLSEQLIFVSSEGEVAVYQGTDPVSDFTKVGTYRIGTPLGNQAFFRGGGDVAIATSVGLVPLSKAISLDVTSLSVATVSYKIADAWSEAVQQRGDGNWQLELWPEQKLAIVAPPNAIGSGQPVMFVSNTETGAWARFTGWEARSMCVFRGQLFFGSTGGAVFLANVSGRDDGTVFTGAVAPLFEDMGSPGSLKIGRTARPVMRGAAAVVGKVEMLADYRTTFGVAPNAGEVAGGSVWDSGIWGVSTWSNDVSQVVTQQPVSISGTGYALSLGYQVSSASIAPLDAEMIRLEMTYETAEILT